MSHKARRVEYHLDPKGIEHLSPEEIKFILRGTDDLIMSGGRSLLTKLLKGSREKKVLQLELDHNPAYGYYRQMSLVDILARIDWVILHGYLNIEYDYRLPLLVYSQQGWEIEKETYASELLCGFDKMLQMSNGPFDMLYLKDKPRDLIMLLLAKVENSRDIKYVPLLEAWEQIDYKKVRQRILKSLTILLKSEQPIEQSSNIQSA